MEPCVQMGDLISVVYRTEKGSDGLLEYEHEFGPSFPKLCVSESGLLLIAGGSYSVLARGIVG